MRRVLFIALFLPSAVYCQPADLPVPAATTDQYPPGVKTVKTELGTAYANKKGKTLYGLDMRTLLRSGPDPAQYCTGECASHWEPLLAPKSSVFNIQFPRGNGPNAAPPPGFFNPQTAPDWTIIAGPQGPQWVYKGWHMAYVRKGEKRGGTAYDGAEGRSWNVLRFVPPAPKINAPGGVKATFLNGAYAFTDKDGHALYSGPCALQCQDWEPFPGGSASAGIGDWKVNLESEVPQWTYRGEPVFVSREIDNVPEGGKILRP